MKAVTQYRYGGPEVLALREVERPTIGAGEVLVRVHAAGVDAGVWHMTRGLPYLVRPFSGFRRPRRPVPGFDVAGTVEAIGVDVREVALGDEVFGIGAGTFAEFTRAKAAKLAPKPRNLTFEQAAAVPISGLTALQAVREVARPQSGGRAGSGQRMLVLGSAGGVGSFAVQIAKSYGVHVTGVCSTAKRQFVLELGADEVLDYTRVDITDGTRKWDAIIDTGGLRPLHRLRRALVRTGTLLIVGGEGGGRWFGGTGRGLRATLLSAFVPQQLRGFLSTEKRADLLVLTDLIESGAITPAVDRVFPLADTPDALRYRDNGLACGKVAISMSR